MSNKGKQFLSDLKLYSDYLKFDEEKGRYETWEEACDKVFNTHRMKYGSIVDPLIEEVKQSYYDKEFLASQRNLQFREELILKNNCKLYNCCVSYAYSPDVFSKGFFILLSGTGLGISLKNKFVNQLPSIDARTNGTKTYVVDDSIEGWADAARVLISSYCKHPSLDEEFYNCKIRFDFSEIRPRGSYITGGFKAPGPEGLKQSLERIEKLLDEYLGDAETKPFKSIIAYDIFMHLSDAVLSGGVRRSAMNVIIDEDDEDMLNAKTGDWFITHPWRARSNNSVGLIRNEFSKEKFENLVALNEGASDIGFVFMGHEDEMFNPCFEIGFNFYEQVLDKNEAVFQFCNLDEINASACSTSTGKFDEEKFYELCRVASIVGTLQAGYTDFPYLGKQTEYIVSEEALLGVSITGWMGRPELFNEEILKKGAEIVKATNEEVAKIIGIKTAARSTTSKPSGNASVVLQTPSGVTPEHSKRYFRVMQLNKDSETAHWLEENKPEMLEDSVWSATGSDYTVFVPCMSIDDQYIYKSDMQGVDHLKLIEIAQAHWVRNGKREDRCFNPLTEHNISNTVIIDDKQSIVDYIFDNQDNFTAVSFLSGNGDKDYNQAPFSSVLTTEELVETYGDGTMFMSGLIVDGLHYFDNNLWEATDYILDVKKDRKFTGTRAQVLLKKDFVRRAKKMAKNYFKGDLEKMVYCMKDVHLWHKWNKVSKGFKLIDFTEILTEPRYTDVDTMGAIACAGGQCEI